MKNLCELLSKVKSDKKKDLLIVGADNLAVLRALKRIEKYNIVNPILMGEKDAIETILNKNNIGLNNYEIKEFKSVSEMIIYSSEQYSLGNDIVIMKGNVQTAEIMKNIINRKNNLIGKNHLSHVALFESKFYPKLFALTDAAVNINPSLKVKVEIIKNAVSVLNQIGVANPKVACLSAIEKVNEKMQSTIDAFELKNMYEKGFITDCIVDGPLALDNAISKEAATIKNIKSDVSGDADILLVPEINSGNMLYKSLTYFSGSICASLIVGANVPIVITSRTDSEENKFYSVILSCIM